MRTIDYNADGDNTIESVRREKGKPARRRPRYNEAIERGDDAEISARERDTGIGK